MPVWLAVFIVICSPTLLWLGRIWERRRWQDAILPLNPNEHKDPDRRFIDPDWTTVHVDGAAHVVVPAYAVVAWRRCADLDWKDASDDDPPKHDISPALSGGVLYDLAFSPAADRDLPDPRLYVYRDCWWVASVGRWMTRSNGTVMALDRSSMILRRRRYATDPLGRLRRAVVDRTDVWT